MIFMSLCWLIYVIIICIGWLIDLGKKVYTKSKEIKKFIQYRFF